VKSAGFGNLEPSCSLS